MQVTYMDWEFGKDANSFCEHGSASKSLASVSHPIATDDEMIDIREITAEETMVLRQSILRSHQTVEDCVLPGDEHPTSFHFGAFCDDQLVTIASVFHQSETRFSQFSQDKNQFRLRGMGTLEPFRQRGFASAVLQKCISRSWELGGDLFWCNARTSASGYYEKMLFQSIPDEFEIAGIGPHRVMFIERT